MENFYPFADELAPEFEPVEELKSNWEDSIIAILTKTPDPRLTNEHDN